MDDARFSTSAPCGGEYNFALANVREWAGRPGAKMLGRSPDWIQIGRPAQPFSRKGGNKKGCHGLPMGLGWGGALPFDRFHRETGETFFRKPPMNEKPGGGRGRGRGGGQMSHWQYPSKLGDRGNLFLLARSPYGDRGNLLIERSKNPTSKPFQSGDRGNLSTFCRLHWATVETFPHVETEKRL